MTVIETFFQRLGAGDLDGALALVAPDAAFVAVREGREPRLPLYGTWQGRDEVRRLLGLLGEIFATEIFSVHHALGDGRTEFASGHLRHVVRATGRVFECDWAVVCAVADGMIQRYQFFEDTARLEEAAA